MRPNAMQLKWLCVLWEKTKSGREREKKLKLSIALNFFQFLCTLRTQKSEAHNNEIRLVHKKYSSANCPMIYFKPKFPEEK
jgi:hypothetical protein